MQNSKATLAAPGFGSASVTIFFKPDVIPLLDKLSPATKAIWAVNTMGHTGHRRRKPHPLGKQHQLVRLS
ncbi:uncharacterized protein HD556DRAFT_1407527 [Suillus plorans]|uniref:Shikimate dehydrogenase substrate binding N-terminal domain-containing protein n=1 Tax=Suillus plorans TaxID=116603 RepID=A0A9P7DCH2_9AGAM|nr:uncharacterized protein HD556DRAFT_1407527 [Suillus plorans]KAG1787756.1 hypothetical protein HD556DRAFT_1407527 [Suillus plorans]